jgi:hypothetical protein
MKIILKNTSLVFQTQHEPETVEEMKEVLLTRGITSFEPGTTDAMVPYLYRGIKNISFTPASGLVSGTDIVQCYCIDAGFHTQDTFSFWVILNNDSQKTIKIVVQNPESGIQTYTGTLSAVGQLSITVDVAALAEYGSTISWGIKLFKVFE